jgi:hypothetical protein
VAICEYRGKHSIRLSADAKSRFFIHNLQQILRKFLKGYSQLAISTDRQENGSAAISGSTETECKQFDARART